MMKKPAVRIGLSLLVLALGIALVWGAYRLWFDPYRGTVSAFSVSETLETRLTAGQAAADLDYIMSRVKERHPVCIDGLPSPLRLAYERERELLAAAGGVSVLELWQSAARVLSLLGDAHTAVGVNYDADRGARLPLSFLWEGDILYCSGGEYDGYAVHEVGGIPTAELYMSFLEHFSYETEVWARHTFSGRLNRAEYLAFFGVETGGDILFLLESPEGGEGEGVSVSFAPGVSADDGGGLNQEAEPNLDFSTDPSAGVGVFTLYRCVYDEEYRSALFDFFTAVREDNIHSIIVDLRGNPGGNSFVANEFIRYLPAETYFSGSSEVRFGSFLLKNKPQTHKNKHLSPIFSGDVYVLTGADSFSSAMSFATLISDNRLGIIVGESPGNMPSSYGDILSFQTPNARLIFTVSYKYFIRPDAAKSDQLLIPDLQISAKDALDAALGMIEGRRGED